MKQMQIFFEFLQQMVDQKLLFVGCMELCILELNYIKKTSIPVVQPSMKKVGGFLWLWDSTDFFWIQQLTTPRPLNVTYTRLFFLFVVFSKAQ